MHFYVPGLHRRRNTLTNLKLSMGHLKFSRRSHTFDTNKSTHNNTIIRRNSVTKNEAAVDARGLEHELERLQGFATRRNRCTETSERPKRPTSVLVNRRPKNGKELSEKSKSSNFLDVPNYKT